jgi:hypothetical protein
MSSLFRPPSGKDGLLLQRCRSSFDTLDQLLGIQTADRMLDDQKLRLRLPHLGLRAHQRQESFGDDDVGFNAAVLELDAVMETPRRA